MSFSPFDNSWAVDFVDRADRSGAKGDFVAKDQKRGNREARKPKANRTPVAAPPLGMAAKATVAPALNPKKKR
jgi:hypothetical protein